MTHSQLRGLAIGGTLAMALLVGGCQAPRTAAEAMVDARATFLTAEGAFTLYAMQPFCDAPAAPKPPLCADRAAVRQGAAAAREVATTLDAADVIVAAKGQPDLGAISTLVAKFVALVAKARGG